MFCPDVMRCVQVEAANERARLAAKNILESEESNGTSEFSRRSLGMLLSAQLLALWKIVVHPESGRALLNTVFIQCCLKAFARGCISERNEDSTCASDSMLSLITGVHWDS